MKAWIRWTMGCVVAVCGFTAHATDRYVSLSGNSVSPFTNRHDAANTIQAAVDAAVDGDTVLVDSGLYAGAGNRDILIEKNLALKSLNGPTATTIDCGDETRAFGIFGTEPVRLTSVVIDGFTIQHAHAHALGDWGSTYPGNIIHVIYAAPTLRNCIIRSNRVTSGYSTTHASVMDVQPPSQTGKVENCVIVENNLQSGENDGAAVYLLGCARVFNTTIASNTLSQGGRRMITTGPGGFYNSIIWGNSGLTAFSDQSGGAVPVEYSDVEGGHTGTGNLNASPLFSSDYSLQDGSPGIDNGSNSHVTSGTDVVGGPRIVNGVVDMGAYEANPDSDSDGIPNWWMNQYFGHPTGQAGDNSLAASDADGDGYTNLEEFQNGGNPLKFDVGSAYIWTAVEIGWKSVAGTNYQVQYTTDLSSSNWLTLRGLVPGNGSTNTVFDTTRTSVQRYYRVVGPTNMNLSEGLVAYYPFNGNANDESGNGNNLGNLDGQLVANRFGTAAAAFRATNSHIAAQSIQNVTVSGNANRTISFWCKPASTAGTSIGVGWGTADGIGTAYEMTAGFLGDGTFIGDLWGSYVAVNTGHLPGISPAEWHHVCVVYAGAISGIRMYVDGASCPIQVDLTTGSDTVGTVSTSIKIGGWGWDHPVAGCQIDDIRIYNRALSESEVVTLYQLPY